MSEATIWVDLDVHKDSIVAAILCGRSPDPEVIRLTSNLMRIRKLFRRLAKAASPARSSPHPSFHASPEIAARLIGSMRSCWRSSIEVDT